MYPIDVHDLHHTYPDGTVALQGVSLRIAPGEAVALAGHNGAGKSTLARHLNGLLLPTVGHVTIGDWDTRQQPVEKIAGRVGYVFQNPDDQLFSRTIKQEVNFGPQNLGFAPAKTERLVADALQLTGLADLAHASPFDLAWAARRRVALAAVLAMATPIVVLDEPTAGQDHRSLARLSGIITKLRQRGKTLVAITHDLDFAAAHFDRLVIMKSGKVAFDGTAIDALADSTLLAEAGLEPPPLARLSAALALARPARHVAEFLDLYQQKMGASR